jgi:hypothetical protein
MVSQATKYFRRIGLADSVRAMHGVNGIIE